MSTQDTVITEWAHLPNAQHIDWIINSVKTKPDMWKAVKYSYSDRTPAQWVAYNAAWDVTDNTDRDYERDAARRACHAIRIAVEGDALYDALYDVVLALVAYDDCAKYLDMTPDEIEVWAALSNNPAAILLQPMMQVMHDKIGGAFA